MKFKRLLLTSVVTLSFFICCKKQGRLPLIVTSNVYSVTHNSAGCGGVLYAEGDAKVTEKGLCWSASNNPSVSDNKIVSGNGEGNFAGGMSDLSPSTKYYVRAFAVNKYGVGYGSAMSFFTSSVSPLPSVSLSNAFSVNENSASLVAALVSGSTAKLSALRLCWGTNPQPTIADNSTAFSFSGSTYTGNLTGLSPNSTYYARVYMSGSAGTAYGNEISFKTLTGTVTDIDGNVYYTITIGTQVWMTSSLRVTRYQDGSNIFTSSLPSEWGNFSVGAYCSYLDNSLFDPAYGKLYNWYAASDPRNIAPPGWHVPSDAEWSTLIAYLGGNADAGTNLKEAGTEHWVSPGGNNSSGFTALPGGGRSNNGEFSGIQYSGTFWSSSSSTATQGWLRSLVYASGNVIRTVGDVRTGYSIRCVKD
jgi:uncharacterized protein (TIGR02145 family)